MLSETTAERRGGGDFRAAELFNGSAGSEVLLVCEHASNFIPARFNGLGLSAEAGSSHAAWDPGALEVARHLSALLDARLVASSVSRLLYDCNRPPEARDAIPERSERYHIPGNFGLSEADRAERVNAFYLPFCDLLEAQFAAHPKPSPLKLSFPKVSSPKVSVPKLSAPKVSALVTIHSFTPVYMGRRRQVEIGVLHDSDHRLADEILKLAPDHTRRRVMRNQPYGPGDGVTHTLRLHGVEKGILNVMLEIRNDLIATEVQQRSVADMLAGMLAAALGRLGVEVKREVRQ